MAPRASGEFTDATPESTLWLPHSLAFKRALNVSEAVRRLR
jgi:hypothetical protein